jgi:hypothetical protein
MRVLELKGYKSLRAFNAFHALMLGLKMLPTYMGEQYETFFDRIQKMSDNDKKKMIKEAALFVELQKEEVEALVCFVADKNGVPFSSENLKNLTPADLVEIIVAVCFEISKIKIDFVSEDEKKN